MTFWHAAHPVYVQARGGGYFTAMANAGFDVQSGPTLELRAGKLNLILAQLTGDAAATDTLASVAACTGACVLVDVVCPFWEPDSVVGLDPGASEHWRRPEVLAQAERAVRVADGVTTSNAAYTEWLVGHNSQVFVVPDVAVGEDDDPDWESLAMFGRALSMAWHTAQLAKAARQGAR